MKHMMLSIAATAALASAPLTAAQFAEIDTKLLPLVEPYMSVDADPADRAILNLHFKFASCRPFTFEAKVEDTELTRLVSVDVPRPAMDCMGPVQLRSYELEIVTESNIYKRTVILNPIGIKAVRTRHCTAEAGFLVSPEDGQCVGYLNGCQLEDMKAVGFRFPEAGECELN